MTQIKIDVADAYERALPLAECWSLADPALVTQYQELRAWPEKSAQWKALSWDERFEKKPPGLPKGVAQPGDVQRHTNAAEADVWRDAWARLDDGRLCILAFQEPRHLDHKPVQVPAALVKQSKVLSLRDGKIKTGAMIFVECKVLRREDLEASAGPKPNYGEVAGGCDGIWAEDRDWLGEGRTLSMIAAELVFRDGKFERMAPATLEQYISRARKEARAAADGSA